MMWTFRNAYLPLVGLAVTTVMVCTGLSQRIAGLHAEHLRQVGAWNERTNEIVSLQALAEAVHLATGEHASTKDPVAALEVRSRAVAAMEAKLRSVTAAFGSAPRPLAADLQSHVERVARTARQMIARSEQGALDRDVDRALGELNGAISGVTNRIRGMVMVTGERALEGAERVEQWQRRIAVGAVPLMIAMGGLGWGVSRRLERTIGDARSSELRARDALRQFEALRATIDSHSIISVADSRGRIIHANDAFCAITGYGRDELLGQDHRLINSGTHPRRFWTQVWRTILSGRPWRGEVCNRAKDGSLYWVDSIIAPFAGADGKIQQFVSIRHDITARKAAEAKARDGEEFVHNALDSLNSHTVVIGSDGRIRSFNRAWQEFADMNGGAAGSVLAGADYLAACDRARAECPEAAAVAAAIRSSLAGEAASPGIEYACHAPFEKRWFLCSIRGFSLREQRYAVISHHNITAIKTAEQRLSAANAELARAHQELEERVRQRTAQLAEATKAAQAASRAKSDFLATMSHEIRTPLNGVVGTLDLLQGSKMTEQQRRYINIGKTSAMSLISVINDILDFSKIEAGKLELSPVDFDVRNAAQDVMEMLAVKAAERNLELVCIVDPGVPTMVHGDADRLRQILINLVNNAIKFTMRGSITLRVGTGETATHADPRLRFTITDTGIGIPKGRIDRLFKAFSQTDASFSRKYGGTGLGLAICKQLAELMGGAVGVESEFGRGSTFWFEARLPAVEGYAEPEQPAAIIDHRGVRVLVVEDHPVQRECIAQLLRGMRFSVETATDGESALARMSEEAARGRPFAVVLADHTMPGMDGVEVAAAMQSTRDLANIPVILLSSVIDLDPARVRSIGFSSHLTKPIRPAALLQAVVNAAGAGPGPSAATEEAPTTESELPGRRDVGQAPKLRVLLAEDNEINQLVASEVLSRAGFACTVAPTGAAAVAAVMENRYDLVLMDCQMPEMDGFEATREIRRLERIGALTAPQRRVPIIALTANALKGDRARCLEAGMDGYVSKPIDLKELLETIESVLALSPAARAAA